MLLLKIIDKLLMPSVFLMILIILGIVLIKLKKRKTGWSFLFGGVVLLYLFSITPVADLIISPLENKYPQLEEKAFDRSDTIILLLGDREGSALRAAEVLRIYTSRRNQGLQDPRVIVSGSDFLKPGDHAALEIKNYLAEQGVPLENIDLESISRTTGESAKQIIKNGIPESFFLVTSGYHMPRSMSIFRKLGAKPIAAPGDFKIKKKYTILDFFPSGSNLRKTEHAFHEYFGLIYYKLKFKLSSD